MKITLIDKIHRFIFGPQPGDVYQLRTNSNTNPFDPLTPTIVEVIEIRKSWVQFKYTCMYGEPSGTITEWELRAFVVSFELIYKADIKKPT